MEEQVEANVVLVKLCREHPLFLVLKRFGLRGGVVLGTDYLLLLLPLPALTEPRKRRHISVGRQ